VVKILSQSGKSLADLYDVQGSIAGVEELDSREVTLVHEMGKTLFAERFFTVIRLLESGDVLQSVAFNVVISNLPQQPWRILGIAVMADATTRLATASVSLQAKTSGNSREYPIWSWDVVNDTEQTVRWSNDGAGVANTVFLIPSAPLTMLPNISAGQLQPHPDGVQNIALRGKTSNFGAGTVEVRLLLHIGTADAGGGSLSSRGLPVPSW